MTTINRFLSASDILFGAEVNKLERTEPEDDGNASSATATAASAVVDDNKTYKVTLKTKRGKQNELVQVKAKAIIDARGIGEAVFPPIANLKETAKRQFDDFMKTPTVGSTPTVLHSKDFYSITSALANPILPFVKKTVAVVGSGDSGKTIIEYLLRLGPSDFAYGENGNTFYSSGSVRKVLWVGQALTTKETYQVRN